MFVPFGGVINSYFYYLFWAVIGIRNQFQKGFSPVETAKANYMYSKTGVKYLNGNQIDAMLERIFTIHSFDELYYIKHGKGRMRKLYKLISMFPFLLPLYRFAHTRVLFFQK